MIDEYIANQAPKVQPILRAVRETIRVAAPLATEKMAWSMPTFWQGENLVHFAASKHHLGIYPGAEAIVVFADRLAGKATSKGAIRFPYDKPIDHELIGDIVRWRVGQAEAKPPRPARSGRPSKAPEDR
ncbi:MAG: DUF1801 domain-containing protein [Bifidobacteriaceae bacterium]|nr:DUF1801 domain-containing protein [Bifidobacteriaceae bacterium]